jgi:membrane protease YdiL (CAAX protease family)
VGAGGTVAAPHSRAGGLSAARDRLALACVAGWTLGAAATPWLGLWGGIAATALALGTACAFLAREDLAPLIAPRPALVGLGLLAGLVMLLATYSAYPVMSRWTVVKAGVPPLYSAVRSLPPAVLVVVLPLVIVAEELVWRGVVYDALRRRLPAVAAVAAAAVLYAAAHAPARSWLLTSVALACGAFWTALRAGSRSLVPCTLAHLIWDVLVMALKPLEGP